MNNYNVNTFARIELMLKLPLVTPLYYFRKTTYPYETIATLLG